MATVSLLNQGLNNEFHLDEIQRISAVNNIQSLTLCSAFANSAGIDLILSNIPTANIPSIKFFLGVKNGITSYQAVQKLVSNGIETYIVDTGGVLFHPKIYLANSDTTGYSIIGSANLTLSGLTQNIEISTVTTYDLNDANDLASFNSIKDVINDLPNAYPNNVFQISSLREIVVHRQRGVLKDERVFQTSVNKNTSNSSSHSSSPSMGTHRKYVNRSTSPKTNTQIKRIKNTVPKGVNSWISVWESGGLVERDLNIPRGPNTNPTGSMLFKKGNTSGIDQRHYFRDVVFKDLDWQNDANPSMAHYERTTADFEIEIQGVSHGVYTLRLAHNSSTTSSTYLQNNSVTKLHWDNAKALVADRNLLGETLTLYKGTSRDDLFKIEIG